MHCKSYSHFFSKKFQHICVSPDVNFNELLTNDIVSFEQLGPDNKHGTILSPVGLSVPWKLLIYISSKLTVRAWNFRYCVFSSLSLSQTLMIQTTAKVKLNLKAILFLLLYVPNFSNQNPSPLNSKIIRVSRVDCIYMYETGTINKNSVSREPYSPTIPPHIHTSPTTPTFQTPHIDFAVQVLYCLNFDGFTLTMTLKIWLRSQKPNQSDI